MNDRHLTPLAALLGSFTLCLAQGRRYAPLLPELMASHFGANGDPNAWMEKSRFLHFYVGIVGSILVIFLAIAFVIAVLKPTAMNLPHKEYWLAPERRRGTQDFLAGSFLWYGAATELLMLDVFHQVFRFNIGAASGLAHPLTSLLVYALVTGAWGVRFALKFGRIPSVQPS